MENYFVQCFQNIIFILKNPIIKIWIRFVVESKKYETGGKA
jgi:hypothetical protein